MTALIIDTSNEPAILILAEEKTVKKSIFLESGKSLSSNLVVEIENLTKDLLHKLDFIGVGTGPGSYTGIRSGVTVAKALAYSLNIPLVSFCSLHGYIPQENKIFVSMLDARSGGVYLLAGKKENLNLEYTSKPLVLPLEEAFEYIQKSDLVISPHADKLQKRFSDLHKEKQPTYVQTSPNEHRLVNICMNSFERKEFAQDYHLEIHYLKSIT